MAFVQDLEFYKEMVILLSFDKDVLTDPSWFSVEQPFTIKQAPCSVSLSFKSRVGLYQNPLALFLFSNSYVAEVSESSRLKEPWMSLLSKSKCTQFLYSPSTLASLLQPKMAAVWGKWQGEKKKKNATNSLWKSNGKYFQFQDVIHTTAAASAAAAKSLQSCPTLCDPIDGSPSGSPSLGFSRQEQWGGLPFPSPMHESEKWKWSRSVMSDS